MACVCARPRACVRASVLQDLHDYPADEHDESDQEGGELEGSHTTVKSHGPVINTTGHGRFQTCSLLSLSAPTLPLPYLPAQPPPPPPTPRTTHPFETVLESPVLLPLPVSPMHSLPRPCPHKAAPPPAGAKWRHCSLVAGRALARASARACDRDERRARGLGDAQQRRQPQPRHRSN